MNKYNDNVFEQSDYSSTIYELTRSKRELNDQNEKNKYNFMKTNIYQDDLNRKFQNQEICLQPYKM